MTNEEIICGWMQPRPRDGDAEDDGKWWRSHNTAICFGEHWITVPADLTLDRLHEVEARLTDEQWEGYIGILAGVPIKRALSTHDYYLDHMDERELVHATAEQKIKALAEVIRAGAAKEPKS